MNFDVFISYSHADQTFVDLLAGGMEAIGLKVFRDSTSLSVYDRLDSKLKVAIAGSRFVCAVISPSYLKSYWCLFEAIEAIRDQDLNLKFLPLVLAHNQDDQSLDERFVIDALGDIRNQRQKLEAEIIEHKAYGLYEKLDKLSFVQDYLPRIFTNLQSRVYPRFPMWDKVAVDQSLLNLFEFLSPGQGANALKAIENIDPGRNPVTPSFRPQLDPMPILLWSTFVGIQAWRNKPIVSGNSVYVASSGEIWNASDALDGVLCVDLETGSKLWHAPINGDANEILLTKGMLLVGSDDGELVALNAQNGARLWNVNFDCSVVSGPMKLPSIHGFSHGRRLSEDGPRRPVNGDKCIIVLSSGEVCILDLDDGHVIERRKLGRDVRGKAKVFSNPDGDTASIFVPHVGGYLTEIKYLIHFSDHGSILDNEPGARSACMKLETVDLSEYQIGGRGRYNVDIVEAVTVVDAGHQILVGLARNTHDDAVPLMALNRATLKSNWVIQHSCPNMGNLRAEPLVFDGLVVLAPAYYDGLAAFNLSNGKYNGKVSFGGTLFEHWSSPVLKEKSIYLGRIDGFLHKFDTTTNKLSWSMYLGHHSRSGMVYRGKEYFKETGDAASWNSGTSSAIYADPVVAADRMIVGTSEGYLYCLANI